MSQLDFEISQRPDFAIVTVRMQPGEKVYSEPAAMASMTPSLKMKAGIKGGWKKALGRMFAGESLIVNTFSAETAPGEVLFAPGIPGDMMHYELDNNSLYLQRGAFLAARRRHDQRAEEAVFILTTPSYRSAHSTNGPQQTQCIDASARHSCQSG